MFKLFVFGNVLLLSCFGSNALICPDSSECPDDNTCCKLSTGSYGCCPLPDATCCSDGEHCCPSGYQCDLTTLTCFDGATDESLFAVKKQRAIKLEKAKEPRGHALLAKLNSLGLNNVGSVTCPDSSQCNDGYTCCLLKSGQFGCCPYPNAVCCNDYIHCCPNNYYCNIPYCSPKQRYIEQPWEQLTPVKPEQSSNLVLYLYDRQRILCPDEKSTCPEYHTCCSIPSGGYACCNFPSASCCEDGIHCCPEGFRCDSKAEHCVKEILEIPMVKKTPAKPLPTALLDYLKIKNSIFPLAKPSIVDCPGGVYFCQDGQTCCEIASGVYGCCNLPDAVCCSDKRHCCPQGTTCDVGQSKCLTPSGLSVDMVEKKLANIHKHMVQKAAPIQCPDEIHYCPQGSTCCLIDDKNYGCCPSKDAVCCEDKTHCCPHGTTCKKGQCMHNGKIVSNAIKHFEGIKIDAVACNDGSHCPDGNTCCKLSSGGYGCCPLRNAVCCPDQLHCCPTGYTCSTGGFCTLGSQKLVASRNTIPFREEIKSLSSNNCSDGSQCPNGQSCCELDSGSYGCCPFPNAVCCRDRQHCCPEGNTCDEKGFCIHENVLSVTPASKHTPSIRKSSLESVMCADGISQCPDGNTCCKLSSGQYGCCPLPKAVCCSDGVHCCPNGYTCDTGSGSCNREGYESIVASKHTPSIRKSSLENVVCPDGISQCPDGNTCCKLSSGQYGCCPLPKAVCCSDGVHCCPSGYTCDTASGSCNREGYESIIASKHTPSIRKSSLESVECPDGTSECPDGNTCCKLSSGQYGCCPSPKAVCCSDGVHCCPNGYTCASGSCNREGYESIIASKHTPSIRKSSLESVVCPDGTSECPDGNTCCKLSSGQYGCCPLPKAVCCSDGVHCCPSGYTCDTASGSCNREGYESIIASKHTPSIRKSSLESVVCPDGTSECPDGSTCCKLSSGQYGCCPLPNAVCCSDGVHCCPNGYTCDTASGTCNRESYESIIASKHTPSIRKSSLESVVCPDGTSECPDGNTCCKLSSGQYGCCPLPKAVCCSDGVHCCPSGYTCDTASGSCNREGYESIIASKHTPSIRKSSLESVECPDGTSECPDGNTCCKLSSGQYGCCPLPKAVCCSDGVHCCPSGYTCDTASGSCNREGYESIIASKHTPSIRKSSLESVECPDGTSECPDGNTCCKLSSGQYGCCPSPKAVCCSDGVHCCPNGYTCASGSCNREGYESIIASKHTPSIRKSSLESVVCPDGTSECPDGNTCCKLSSGQYGCCPLPKAVCCSDGVHCCPSGYTCDTASGSCNREGYESIIASKHTPSIRKSSLESVVCPDGTSECPDGNTCCKLSSGQYGCCPSPKAVCCSDGVHCCPNGYTCASGSCNREGYESIIASKHTPSIRKSSLESVVCPDGTSECPDGNTCCKLSSGQYGCCPLPKAVCCSDGVHCCPSGYTCDTASGSCNRDSYESIIASKHTPSIRKSSLESVECPDGTSECPDGNTCCKLSSGQYGCCPSPKAVCCSDGVHCCPNGYTCASGTCNREGYESIIASKHTPSIRKSALESVVCPDGISQCPDGNTCCKLSSGQYGCCPLPKAVCCSDGVHCCPNGYTCASGTCNREGYESIIASKHTPSIRKSSLESVVCPDGTSECPDGNTCCKLSSGQYGCCPLPKAVCCSDGVHCCPNGYTCDTASGSCNREGYESIIASKHTPSIRKSSLESVECPDGTSECPDGNTCCKLSSGQYGCCPSPKAVCCSDGVHCCPNGYTCASGSCNREGYESIIASKHTPSIRKSSLESVVCPDGTSECPDGNTCCKLSSGQYGCCPLPKAVCCSDGVHCCPSGYTCDTASGSCNREGYESIIASKHTPSIRKSSLESVVCPDGTSECPDGNTCCKLSSGQYGCCPSPKAVCCSDGVHCCPNGYTCASGSCNREGYESIIASKHTPSIRKSSLESVVCPDGTSECPDGNTCCKLSSGQYGCCPLPKAVCCSDGVHCCPSGYTCDTASGSCNRDSYESIIASKHTPSIRKSSLESVECPDGTSECPDGNTCCKLSSGQYGCCPSPKAVCCSDGVHCCPNGYTCASGTCNREGYESIIASKHTPSIRKSALESVVCPDGISQCPDGNTCCKLSSGQYGCCPLPKAVCCSDGVHCCPNGYTCASGTCNREGYESIIASKHTPSIRKSSLESVVCPDGTSECPDGNTCCKLSSGQYGCCPLPKAVCCSDGVHCCPNGYTCDTASGSCNREGYESIIASKHTPSIRKSSLESVVCPDGTSECPDGNTCCKLSSGQYGCCPLPKAVCCSDGVHCCPNGYTCDTASGSCNREGYESIIASKHTPSIRKSSLESVVCPDGTSECPDGNTCCKLSSGQYGCCPSPKAVCCSDGVHCCPNGYTCASGSCNREGYESIIASKHTPSIRKSSLESVVCPDGTSECPDGNTCCKLSSGQYGCCPLPKAVCCSDGVHCCPSGYTCDTASGSCNRDSYESIIASKHTPSIRKSSLESVECPDGTSECPDGYTCCKLSSGQYGCCPSPKAVCCSDGVHCCPNGYTCASGTCNREGYESIIASKHTPSIRKSSLESVVCPDGISQCPDGNTCCKLSSGQYGCCPLPKAVCCSDGVHCCPNGYTCDTASGSCNREGYESIIASKHTPSIRKSSLESVVCPDGTSECPVGSTCCKLSTGQYGCCPLPNAVCCSDGVHCCPNGYTCDTASGSCNREGYESIIASKHTPSIRKSALESVVCPDGTSECPDGSTCCKLSTGQYGCCPLPKAVCCSDGVHCCPNGYTCASGTCNREGYESIIASKHTPSIRKSSLESVVCPDGTSECPDGNTCCKLSSGQYGCCPLPKAVCCSDGVHCCPNGYTCDTASGSCNREGYESIIASKHTPSIRKSSLESVVCPDGTSECPDGNTCCKLSSGQYGCCPLPKAVCCSDGVHCCPNGYTCDTASGSCNREGYESIIASKHTPSIRKSSLESVVCPDGTSECPDGSTCCKLTTGQYGCCPLPNAVCCPDGVHCCPNGYTCDTASGTCNREGYESIIASKHTPSIRKSSLESVVCPDGISQCPDGNTCCKLSSGQYGCCPLPKAVCCSDGVHCCPNGYTCDTASGTCNREGYECIIASKHTPSIRKLSLESVLCPDGVSECLDGNTCCLKQAKGYGCCPLPNAVCCSDKKHCCPHGYSCNKATCTKDGLAESASKIQSSVSLNTQHKHRSYHKEKIRFETSSNSKSSKTMFSSRDRLLLDILRGRVKICQDGSTQCKHFKTCCGKKCCPYGRKCSNDGTCIAATSNLANTCPDEHLVCDDDYTCCPSMNPSYKCCPVKNGVCCQDGKHCCPKGWKCVIGKGLCKHPNLLSYVSMRRFISPKTDKPADRKVITF